MSAKYDELLIQEKGLPKDFFTRHDKEKIQFLESQFLSFLKNFEYQSKPFEALKISYDNYLPVAQKLIDSDSDLYYNIKFDSSATDFIRCIWAYVISLLSTSLRFQANHPELIMFDEPKQHDISIDDFRRFLKELTKFNKQQILVFASFENSDATFREVTDGIEYFLNRIEGKLIKPL